MKSLATLLGRSESPRHPTREVKPEVVVVIDDEPVCRTSLRRILESLHDAVTVEEFADPGKALEWLKTGTPALVVTDYRMPQLDGIDLIRRLRQSEATAQTPIVLVTVLKERAVRTRALEAGATDFLTKPIDHDECRARCRNLLELSRYQRFLEDQLARRNACLRNLTVSEGQKESLSLPELLDGSDSGKYVLMDYEELYEVTSTLAAMDRLLTPWRNKHDMLEASVRRPLRGDQS